SAFEHLPVSNKSIPHIYSCNTLPEISLPPPPSLRPRGVPRRHCCPPRDEDMHRSYAVHSAWAVSDRIGVSSYGSEADA
ncbi:hypothetical protein PR002_g30904, partial [Phytophthora rubi]